MIEEILKQYWGFTTFRDMQREVIESALSGKDTLAILPTGGGKSICFQIPSLATEGLAIVVTPLISLMKDQVENLNKRGIRAIAIYSGMTPHEIDIALDNAIYGDYKFLYLSPERLRTEMFRVRVKNMSVNYIVVDEAHCISQWGYDFRPDYMSIKEIREILNGVPVIALTATATQKVAEDIMDKLGFEEKNSIRSSFLRPNLAYIVRKTEDKLGQLLKICNSVLGSGIVYVRERKKSEEIAAFLKSQNIEADFYHAGISSQERSLKQERWKSGDLRIIVSTNAFGMGIDKPNVRFVTHFDMPESVESYFQEAGRAGRDGVKSYATLLCNKSDILRLHQIYRITFPDLEYIADLYQKVFSYLGLVYEEGEGQTYKFNLIEFSKQYKLHSVSAFYAIKYIEISGYWTLTEEIDNPSRITFIVNRDDLYKIQLSNYHLDTFVKALMRLYPGLFSHLVAIDEEFIAKTIKDSPENVKGNLISLSRKGIIKYIPRVRSPLISLNNERLTPKNLYLSQSNYDSRKEVFKERMDKIIEYATDESAENYNCRSQRLLAYFGEEDSPKCGVCDLCLSKD